MAELLLELLSEEIPARMQDRAAADLERLVCERLGKAGLAFESARAFATPRRLALVVDGLPTAQPDVTEERRGPRADAPDKAIEGFLKSAGLKSVDQCQVQEIKGASFYVAIRERKGLKTSKIMPSVIKEAVQNLSWPKSMGWGELRNPTDELLGTLIEDIIPPLDVLFSKNWEELSREDVRDKDRKFTWVRPLHGIIAIFSREILPGVIFASGHKTLKFSAQTVGHRFLAPEAFEVKDFEDYREKLRAAYVMLDAAERRAVIEQDAALKAKAEGLTVVPDAALIAENAGLVEWPVVLSGAIDPDYMDLPPEVLTTAMRSHQKYFTLTDADGKLAPRFLMVANAIAGDGGKQIVAGNERVLRARLADAKFFWDTDRKRTLESRVADLDGVTFHAKLGTLGDKAKRIEALAVEIAKFVPGAEADSVSAAARLAKADLTTGMVGEFPELQGVVGRYYALADGQPAEVAEAIAEHYAPRGPADACPSAPVSVCVALADKIDTLVGFWTIGEKPTGSKDPFALRRAALGAVRLVVENQLRVHLIDVFMNAADQLHPPLLTESKMVGFDAGELIRFFADRLKIHLRERGVRHDLISAVFAAAPDDDLVRLLARVEALGAFVASDDGEHLLTAYRRAANIVRIEEKRDGVSYDGTAVDPELLREADEKAVAERLSEVSDQASAALEREDFASAMTAMATLRGPVDAFFDNVTVNCDDADLRRNRLLLLGQIRATLDRVADFSKIEG